MGPQPKTDPIKHCAACNKLLTRKRWSNRELESMLHFNRRKYCNQQCTAIGHSKPTTGTVGWSGEHSRARKVINKTNCELCGSTRNLDIHHIDENWHNHAPDNLQVLCRSCHNRVHRSGRKCMLCDNPHESLGYCGMHYKRFKVHGNPLLVKVNQHSVTPVVALHPTKKAVKYQNPVHRNLLELI